MIRKIRIVPGYFGQNLFFGFLFVEQSRARSDVELPSAAIPPSNARSYPLSIRIYVFCLAGEVKQLTRLFALFKLGRKGGQEISDGFRVGGVRHGSIRAMRELQLKWPNSIESLERSRGSNKR